jgi:hypothetical protein
MKYFISIMAMSAGLFILNCSDGRIPLPTDPLIELKAKHVNERPLLDGKADDSVWQGAQPFIVHLEKNTVQGAQELNLIFKAVWWSEWSKGKTEWEERPFIGILAIWPDDDKNIDKQQWNYDPVTKKWQRSNLNSDWLLMRWYSSSEYNDVWFWDAALTNPMGYAEDEQLLISTTEDSSIQMSLWIDGLSYANDTDNAQNTWDMNYDDNLTPRDSTDDKPRWAWTADITKTPPSVPRIVSEDLDKFSILLKKDASFLNKTAYANPTAAVTIPGYVLEDPIANPADVMAAGRWENNEWTLELVRATITGQANDIVLAPDDRYFTAVFYLALGDNEKTPFEQLQSEKMLIARDPVVLNFEYIIPRVGISN